MLANKTFNSSKAERAIAAVVVAMAACVVPAVVSTNQVLPAMADASASNVGTSNVGTPDASTPNVLSQNSSTPNVATQNASTQNASTPCVLTQNVSTLEDWQKLMPNSGNLLTAENLAKAPEKFDAHQSVIYKTVNTAAGKVVLQKWVPPSDAIFDNADACMRNHQYQQALSKYFQAWKKVFSWNDTITSMEVKDQNQGALNKLILDAQMNNSSKVGGLGRIGG